MNKEDIKEKIRAIVKEELGIVPRVKVLAFGGAAGKVAEYISSRELSGVKVIAVNVDKNVQTLSVDKKMWIGKETLGTHSDTAGEVNVARYIIDRSKSWILEEVREADAVILIAALGGGMGTGGVLETMKILKEKTTKPVMSVLILPFSFEKERRERAMFALETIEKEKLGTYITIDSDRMLKMKGVTLKKGYETMYREIFDVVARISNFTRVTIEKKFEELYLQNFDAVVEEKYSELINETIPA